MRVTREQTGTRPPGLSPHIQPLQEVDSYKYLEVLLSSDLSWTRHIQSLCSKARKLIGLIYHRFYQLSSPESLLQMYLMLVRPHLEYASQVWNTSKIDETDSISPTLDACKKVQKFALRVCSKEWNGSYDKLIQLFSLPTLQQCRLYLDLSTKFKIISSPPYFPSGILWSTIQELQDHSSINHMSVLMHIQINIVTPLYLTPFVTGDLFSSLVPVPCLSVSSLKVAFGHTCKISHCCYIVCPRTAVINLS